MNKSTTCWHLGMASFTTHVCGEMFTNALISSVCDFSGISQDQTASHRCDFVVALQGGGWRALTGRHDGHWARNDPRMCVVGCVVLDCVESPMAVRLFRASPCGSVRAPQGGVRSVQFRASPCVPSRGVSGVVLGTRGFWIAWKAKWLCGYFVQVRAVPCAPHRAGCVPCNSVQVRARPQGACRAWFFARKKGSLSCV